jgi:putative oxidoreductase
MRVNVIQSREAELAALVLTIGLGIMYLAHSVVLKLITFSLSGTAGFFINVGLPGRLAYVTFVAEAVGGVLFILGIQSRWVSLALTPAFFGAIIWVFAASGGGWEYPAFLIIASLVQVLLGDGAYALFRSAPRRLPSSGTA